MSRYLKLSEVSETLNFTHQRLSQWKRNLNKMNWNRVDSKDVFSNPATENIRTHNFSVTGLRSNQLNHTVQGHFWGILRRKWTYFIYMKDVIKCKMCVCIYICIYIYTHTYIYLYIDKVCFSKSCYQSFKCLTAYKGVYLGRKIHVVYKTNSNSNFDHSMLLFLRIFHFLIYRRLL